MTDTKSTKQGFSAWLAIGMFIFVVVAWVGSIYGISYFVSHHDSDHLDSLLARQGQFGDQFGAVNALFSGLAFAALIYTIYLQRIEIKQTQDEMKSQNETLTLQRFENTFFKLLGNYSDSQPRDFYNTAYHSFFDGYSRNINNNQQTEERYRSEFISANNRNNSFSSYFVILKELIYYVDGFSGISDAQKKFYTNVICASLSDHEMWLLFYSIIYDTRLLPMKDCVEKYAMFTNLKLDGLIRSTDKEKYSDSAYR